MADSAAGSGGRWPAGGRWLQAVVAAVLLLAALVVVGTGDGPGQRRVEFHGGAAWLVSDAVGQVALVDGASAKVVTQVPVGRPDLPAGSLSATQSDLDAFVVDTSTGTVGRISGATYAWNHRTGLLPAGRSAELFAGSDALYLLDGRAGVVTTTEAASLTVRGRQSLTARVATGGGVVDEQGRLWLVDTRTGDLVWFDGTTRHDRPHAADPASSRLVLADGRPALVNLARRQITPLSADGRPGAATCLDVGSAGAGSGAADVQLAGATDASRVYAAVGARGVLMVADLATRRCGSVIDLAAAGHRLGIPIDLGDRVFVPDYTAGAVHVVDLAAGRLLSSRRVLPAGRHFTLAAQGGFVFYNDPAGTDAGVIRLDGSTSPVRKYGADTTGNGTGGTGTGTGTAADGAGSGRGSLGAGGTGTTAAEGATGTGTQPTPTPTPTSAPAAGGPTARRTPAGGPAGAGPSSRSPTTTPPSPGPAGGSGTGAGAGGGAGGSQDTAGSRGTNPTTVPQTPPTGTGGNPATDPPAGSGSNPPTTETGGGEPPVGTAPVRIEASAADATVGQVVQFRATGTGVLTAIWTFGDGGTQATGTNASHAWTAPGRFTVTADATLADGRTPSVNAEIVITAKQAEPPAATGPTARVTLTPATGTAPLTVTADAAASTAGTNPINTYSLTWGDGTTATGARATHAFAQTGDYTVGLTVTDTAGRRSTTSAIAHVTAAAQVGPTAQLSARTSGPQAPTDITADASASTAGSTPIATYTFAFSDGTTVGPQASPTATHRVTTAGTYTVNVTVRDQAGRTSPANAGVQVTAAVTPPRAALTVARSRGGGAAAGVRDFDASGSVAGSAPIVSYRFAFGDGESEGPGAAATTSHNYLAGTYQASVTVTDQNGEQDTATVTVVDESQISLFKKVLASSPGGTTWRVTVDNPGPSVHIDSISGAGIHDDQCTGVTLTTPSACNLDVDVPSGTPSAVITVRSNAQNSPTSIDLVQ
ncbi:PKD domain-containing protein [Frankia sp. AgB32]|uniref:PKD domain-containing protein n=1 Tax=Frankia sp. AgB32 TaxID=631119 RepID=UPI00200DC92C|nr:PKD domain-containing protein [Frankia sp. AgB32]MCK9894156.1 PKD domain-containing protein [Frankia sp. AgB32]